MRLLCTLAAAAAALTLAATATASPNHYSARALSDVHIGRAPAELLAQQVHSQHVLAFFHRHHWMTAGRHQRCTQVPWTQTCKIARAQVRLHHWLLGKVQQQLWRPDVVRAWVLAYHPCLDQIIQLEDNTYEPTRSYGGYGNTSVAYGIPQANPGTKMASAGPDWRTNPYTQLRWMIHYVISGWGSECAAAYSRVHSSSY